jgi:hypothetical protein
MSIHKQKSSTRKRVMSVLATALVSGWSSFMMAGLTLLGSIPISLTSGCLPIPQQQEQIDYVSSLEATPADCIDTRVLPDVKSIVAPTDVAQPIAQPEDADRQGIRELRSHLLPQILLHYYSIQFTKLQVLLGDTLYRFTHWHLFGG